MDANSRTKYIIVSSRVNLKPCPFCGGRAQVVECYGQFTVECAVTTNNLCACIPKTWPFNTADEAAAAWNNRAMEDNK